MSNINRRVFLNSTVVGVSALTAGGCSRPPFVTETDLLALGEVVLPAELDAEQLQDVIANFQNWIDGHRSGREVNHGYGTGDLRYTDALPLETWTEQFADLNTRARERFGESFAQLELADRESVVRAVLEAYPEARLTSADRSEHIALALLTFFVDSPLATDLAYRAAIKRRQCRPLRDSPQRPIALG